MFSWLKTGKRSGPSAKLSVPIGVPAKHDEVERSPSDVARMEGNALLDQNQLEAAVARYRDAVLLDERSVTARIGLSFALSEMQRHAEAEVHLLQAAAIDPANVDAQYMLGMSAKVRGDIDAAIAHLERAIALKPDFELAYRDACLALVDRREFARVEALLKSGIEQLPKSSDLRFLLGNALQVNGDVVAAEQCYRQAVALRPGHSEAHLNLAVVLRSAGRLEEALPHLQTVAALRSGELNAHMGYGFALQSLGRLDQAVECFKRAIAADPSSPIGFSGLGSAYSAQKRSVEAVKQYRHALTLDENYAFAYAGLGVELNEQGRPAEAAESMRKAVALDPAAIEAHSSLLFLMSFGAGSAEYVEEARRYGEKVTALAQSLTPPVEQVVTGTAPLRIGFVSGDLRNHPVAAFLEGVLANLRVESVQVFVYVTRAGEDEVTGRLRNLCTGWQSLVGMDDDAAAKRICADRLQVLIDLAGHTAHNRLPLFAWKPAPVQVTWLGYLASTGLASIDYLLADRVSLPDENRHHFVEKVWYLPNSLYCFTPPASAPPVSPSPAIASGIVTFGSFQRMNKVSEATLEVWGRILRQVPHSRLRLQSKQMADQRSREHILERLETAGVPTERVDLAGPVADRAAYLACHDHVDIVLDTFPYVGITTTCEALWMGVPTVTLAGDTLLSRQGASLLRCLELDDWISHDIDGYVACAVRHAGDLPALARLRASLRERARLSPLFDAVRFARDFERAMHEMSASSRRPALADVT